MLIVDCGKIISNFFLCICSNLWYFCILKLFILLVVWLLSVLKWFLVCICRILWCVCFVYVLSECKIFLYVVWYVCVIFVYYCYNVEFVRESLFRFFCFYMVWRCKESDFCDMCLVVMFFFFIFIFNVKLL